ncbi:polysaccharide biosynthesis tyrosine autokinase [Piscinibacter sakaiensis]|uniref:GumC family protein n=1 Tax=Piscinibacter sakaiensis TaxID=1547922 RepID=UPI003AAD2027
MAQDLPPNRPDLQLAHGGGNPPSQALALRGNQGMLDRWDAREQQADQEDNVLDLRDIWRLIVKHKWMLISVAIVGLLAALLVSFVRTPLYLATTTLQVDKRAPRVVQFGQNDQSAVQEVDDRTGMGTQLELLKSRVLAERVIDELRLDRQGLPMPVSLATRERNERDRLGESAADEDIGWQAMVQNLFDKIGDSYHKLREPAVSTAEQFSREAVVKSFQETVKIEQIRNSSVIKVQVENASPQLAARIANSMAQAFIALNLERRLESSSYAKSFLETQLGLTKARLEESERKLQAYARERNILTLDEKTSVVNQTFVEFSTALSKAEQDRIKADSEYQAVRSNPDTARQVLESRTIQAYKEQRAKLDAEYQENAKIYKAEFPKMKQLKAQIDDLDAKIQGEVQNILASVKNALDTAVRQEELIRTRLRETRQEIVAGQERSVDFNLLKREVDTNRELYNGLLQQVKEVGVAGGVETNNIQVVDKAQVPLFPYKPRIALNAAIGLLAGLVLGLGLVFLMESFDDSIKFADEVERILGVPLLGVIPKVKNQRELTSLALLTFTDARGHMAEAYRSVRTALQFSTSEGAPRRLVVTSTTKAEGKSTTSLALAINFAQLGGKVALIDADMRNPTIHRSLGIGNSQGLSNYLSGHHPEGELLRPTEIANLFVMTAGPIPPSPVDLLTGPKLGELMEHLEAKGVEYIIFDGPPVLGLADAIVLGNQVNSVLYVAQASQTRKSHIKDAFRRLRMAGIVPRGVVLTKTTAQNTAYYTYDNYYGYGQENEPEKTPFMPTQPPLPLKQQA